MKSIFAVLGALLWVSACDPVTPFNEEALGITVDFQDTLEGVQAGDGSAVIPLQPGTFSFVVEIRAVLPRLNGSPLAEVTVEAPSEVGKEGRTASLRLARVDGVEGMETFAGKVELHAPGPGFVRVRASVAGLEGTRDAYIQAPAVAIQQQPLQEGWASAVPRFKVCIETTARAGSLRVSAEGATLLDVPSDGLVGLESGRACHTGLLAGGASRAVLFVASAVPTFVLRARLEGTNADVAQTLTVQPMPLTLQLATVPAELMTLPPAGSLIRLVALAASEGKPAAGIPLRFQTFPEATLHSIREVTDIEGSGEALLQVPADIESLYIEVVAGGIRRGFSLSR
ncbi:hypothetical protein [Corallococcus exiguus]|uniref:hypothetical protein n=1 Tax=Corallococcus exiguus TaxID=83462 RepID=UPI0014941D2C|nr:hypothetical protein [Corallococcus exiguus]NPD26195.1 hypothetical protein [Corallococcus exiguus]